MKLMLDNVSYKYPGSKKQVLSNISFQLNSNKVGLVGTSGSGKSTLIHLLNALHRPTEGTIFIGDYQITNKSKMKKLQKIREEVAIVYQFTDLQLFAESVRDELIFAVNNFNIVIDDIDSVIEDYFHQFNLDLAILSESPFSLSGGQKKKVAIITMLLINPKILILDEPTVGLDPQSVIDIFTAIDKMTIEGLKVIMISHDMNTVYHFCDYIIEIKDGKVIFDDTHYEYFKKNYIAKQLLLLPTNLVYAATIDSNNILYDRLYNGEKLENFLKEKNV